MRHMVTLAAAAALLGAPLQAADLQGGAGAAHAGAFVGVRLRLAMDASVPARPQAALTLAPMHAYRSGDGRTSTRFGDGVALDFARPVPTLTLAGVPADVALGLRQEGSVEAKERLGISTLGWVAIGTVAVAAVVAVTQLTCVGKDKDFCGSD